jgi:hypothetical protein
MPNPKKKNCTICGAALDELKAAQNLVCTYCRTASAGRIRCAEGHFVCDACHNRETMEMIEAIVFSTSEKDPIRIAELIMAHPALPVQGCAHAFIAAGALLAALRNSPYARISDQDFREAFDRTAKQAVDGYCGLTGVCGIAPAVGACFSIFLGADAASDREQKMIMEAVITISTAIARLSGPSCCKAYVRTALSTAVDLFSERFGIVLPVSNAEIVCRHHDRHPHCREESCPYYRTPPKDPFAEPIRLPGTVCHS